MPILPLILAALLAGFAPERYERADNGRAEDAAARLRRRVRERLAEGNIEGALLEAQRAYSGAPADPDVRREFVDLHVSLARQALQHEDFSLAASALAAARKVDPHDSESRRLASAIDAARAAAPARVVEAQRWIRAEWFEAAFRALGQAQALLPDRAAAWSEDFVAAAIGAGDEHYLAKNFHDAFYRYDAALRVVTEHKRRHPDGLVRRWLECAVHALGEDIDRVAYPPDYWHSLTRRAQALSPRGPDEEYLASVLIGLACENMQLFPEAAARYQRRATPIASADATEARRLRHEALRAARRRYNRSRTGRRDGLWTFWQGDEWRVLRSGRFEIRHRNADAAQHVQAALEFHFDRIARRCGVEPDDVPWGAACTIHLHRDEAAFRKETGTAGAVQAASIIRTRARRLASHEIHVFQSDPALLSCTLAHELGHLMIGALTSYRPMPSALAEGLALQFEPPCRHVQFARLFQRNDNPRTLDALLRISEAHPADGAFYAESHRLVSVLIREGGVGALIRGGPQGPDVAALAVLGGFEDAAALESAFRGVGPKIGGAAQQPPGGTARPPS